MKVKELIEELKKFDGDLDVVVIINDGWDEMEVNGAEQLTGDCVDKVRRAVNITGAMS